jgi:Family of unknown function (DUF6264)
VTLFQPPEPPSELPSYGGIPPVPGQGFPTPAVPAPYVRQQWPTDPWAQQLRPAPPLPPRETWRADRVVSIVFLALGLLGAIIGVATAILLPVETEALYQRRGEGFFESSTAGHLLTGLLVSHVVLFVAALAITIPLLRRRKHAFYVPLIAGVIACVIYWVVLLGYVTADHTMRFVA